MKSQRTPADTYPRDPHVNQTFFPYGWGQLTNVKTYQPFKFMFRYFFFCYFIEWEIYFVRYWQMGTKTIPKAVRRCLSIKCYTCTEYWSYKNSNVSGIGSRWTLGAARNPTRLESRFELATYSLFIRSTRQRYGKFLTYFKYKF